MTSRVRPVCVKACFALCSSLSCLHFNYFAVEVVVVIFIEVLIHVCFENFCWIGLDLKFPRLILCLLTVNASSSLAANMLF